MSVDHTLAVISLAMLLAGVVMALIANARAERAIEERRLAEMMMAEATRLNLQTRTELANAGKVTQMTARLEL